MGLSDLKHTQTGLDIDHLTPSCGVSGVFGVCGVFGVRGVSGVCGVCSVGGVLGEIFESPPLHGY